MKITPIDTGFFKLDGGAMFGVVPKSMWNKLNPADDNNMCTWALRCLLIEEGNSLVLIDSGMGTKQDAKFFSHYYLHGDGELISSIRKAGYHESQITDVVHTHLHFDHCGGTLKREGDGYALTFQNARCWVDPNHWQWAIHPNAREKASFLKDNLLPMQDLGALNFLPDDGSSPWPWMQLFHCYGHTEAMALPVIQYGAGILVFVADLFPSVHHVPLPYIMGYDMRPLETLSDKERFFQKALANDWTLFFEHDPVNECARLVQTERGIKAGEGFKWADI